MPIIRQAEHTTVSVHDEPGPGNACHEYKVYPTQYEEPGNHAGYSALVSFQNGPIQENGVNGCQNEDLLAIVIHRLQGFQSGDFACRENAIALTKIQEALHWLEHRTRDRQSRGVEGTNQQ